LPQLRQKLVQHLCRGRAQLVPEDTSMHVCSSSDRMIIEGSEAQSQPSERNARQQELVSCVSNAFICVSNAFSIAWHQSRFASLTELGEAIRDEEGVRPF
jgi:hypothetical protein